MLTFAEAPDRSVRRDFPVGPPIKGRRIECPLKKRY